MISMAEVSDIFGLCVARKFRKAWAAKRGLLHFVRAENGSSDESGRNTGFDTDLPFDGDPEFNSYQGPIPAIFPWAYYRAMFDVLPEEYERLATSVGRGPISKFDFGDLQDRALSAFNDLVDAIENDALVGTGVDVNGNPTLVGIFGGALSVSGSYGGISPHVLPEWGSNVFANGGVPRELTVELLDQARSMIGPVSEGSEWSFQVMTREICRRYEIALTSQGRFTPEGSPEKGLIVGVSDPRVPPGQLAMIHKDALVVRHLPWVYADRPELDLPRLPEPTVVSEIPARVTFLCNPRGVCKASIKVTLAMCAVGRRNCALIRDIAES